MLFQSAPPKTQLVLGQKAPLRVLPGSLAPEGADPLVSSSCQVVLRLEASAAWVGNQVLAGAIPRCGLSVAGGDLNWHFCLRLVSVVFCC